MAQTITAADLLKSQARIEEAYAGDTPSKYPFYEPAMSAAAALINNKAFGQEVLTQDGKHRGFEVNWLTKGASTIVDNTTPGSSTQACTVGSPVGATSVAKLYDNNMIISAQVHVVDDVYGNAFDVQSLIDNRFMAAMKDIRNTLNTKIVNFFDASKTPVNSDGNLPSYIVYNAVSDVYEADVASIDMQSPDGLTDLDALAMNSNLGSWSYLTGRFNFYNTIVDAQYRSRNDSERHLDRFYDPAYNIYTDPRALDATIGSKSTFIIGDGSYAIWDYVAAGKTTTPVEVSADKWEYIIEDPVLMIMDNGVLRPLRYNVFYTRECTSVNKTVGNRTFDHKWEIFLLGGLEVAPPSEDTHTGILRVDSVTV